MKSYGKGSTKNIAEIEKTLNIKLPQDYSNFLLENNGASFSDTESYFYVPELKQQIMMSVLDGVGHKYSIIKTNQEYWDGIPENSLLIGNDTAAGLYFQKFHYICTL